MTADRTPEFQRRTSRISREALIDALEAAKKGDATGQLQVAATMTWAAFSCPDAINAVYDNIASVWLDGGEQPEIDEDFPEAPFEDGFWDAYWAVVEESRAEVIPSRTNAQITALARKSHPELVSIAELSMQNHPRIQAALAALPQGGLDPDVLRSCPEGSLGQTLHGMIVKHGYNQELIDRRLRDLSFLPESLRRVYTRALHMNRPWQLVAGYDTGDAHEIAFSGFLIAQFGIHQAAMMLASFATIGCFLAPKGFYILLYLIAEGWRHGQKTPDFMQIEWESEWSHSVDTIRDRHGITPFRSVFSRNLFEVFAPSASPPSPPPATRRSATYPSNMDRTLEFQEATRRVSRESLVDSLEAAKQGDDAGQLQIAATMTWAAFSCPDAINAVYDNIASVWLGDGEQREIGEGLPEVPLEAGFWEEYWDVVDDSKEGVVPSAANARISALGILAAHPGFMSIVERSVQNDLRVRGAIVGTPSEGLQPDVLRTCPMGSLGQTLYQMIVGHGYSLELIERRLNYARSLPQSFRRVNTRVLQMHRPWELVAGYDSGDAHQIAYGGFQVAQFGLHQAAMVLASFATIGCLLAPNGFYILLHLIAEGWRHGARSPDFMAIDWDAEWVHSVETIRERHGITAFQSVFSKDLFEVFGTSSA